MNNNKSFLKRDLLLFIIFTNIKKGVIDMKKIKVLNKILVEIWNFLSILLHTTTKITMQILIDKFQTHNL